MHKPLRYTAAFRTCSHTEGRRPAERGNAHNANKPKNSSLLLFHKYVICEGSLSATAVKNPKERTTDYIRLSQKPPLLDSVSTEGKEERGKREWS